MVPSITLDQMNMAPSVPQAMEERFLFMLFLLRQPNARMVYADVAPDPSRTSSTTTWAHCPGVIPAHARGRFFNLVPHDRRSVRPLR